MSAETPSLLILSIRNLFFVNLPATSRSLFNSYLSVAKVFTRRILLTTSQKWLYSRSQIRFCFFSILLSFLKRIKRSKKKGANIEAVAKPICQLIELTTKMAMTAVTAPGRKLIPKLLMMLLMPSVPRVSLCIILPEAFRL